MADDGTPQSAVHSNKCTKCGGAMVYSFGGDRPYRECPACALEREFEYKFTNGGTIDGFCIYCGLTAAYIICHGDGTATPTEPVCGECYPTHLHTVRHSKRHGYVYLVDSQVGYFKIGRSSEPVERFRKFDVMLPYDMMVIALIETPDMNKLEKELHKRFAEWRIRGEWFALNPQQVLFIKRIAEVQP